MRSVTGTKPVQVQSGSQENGTATIRPGFLAKPNRINVAMSRAMDRLVVIGSRSRWAKGGPMEGITKAFAECLDTDDGHVLGADELLISTAGGSSTIRDGVQMESAK